MGCLLYYFLLISGSNKLVGFFYSAKVGKMFCFFVSAFVSVKLNRLFVGFCDALNKEFC